MTSQRPRRRAGLLLAMACLTAVSTAALTACSPVIEQRGYILDEKSLKRIKPHQTSMDQVRDIMGSPSTSSTITNGPGGEAFYYISSRFETEAFYPPEEVERTVVAIYFTKENVVDEVSYYGLQDGQVVDLQTRTTPTRGKELTVLGQIFSNLGRFNKATDSKKNTGTSPVPGRPGG